MSFGGSRRLSLVEQKKLQWAKEREEMVGLCGLWGTVTSSKTSDHIGLPNSRTDSQTTLVGASGHSGTGNDKEEEYSSSTKYFQNSQNKRSSSLPPIGSRGWPKQPMEEESVDRDDSVGTSGYNSDSAGTSDPGGQAAGREGRGGWPQEQELDVEEGGERRRRQRLSRHADWKKTEGSRWRSNETMEEFEACEGMIDAEVAARARWGDHGVGVGHLWEPAPANISASRLPPVSGRGETPAWLSRGLDRLQCGDRNGADILLGSGRDVTTPGVSEPSGSESLQESFGRSYLRGQNVPLEADILAERLKRREKAISHQNAIRQQVEEREKKRREERALRLKMEMVEEQRLRQEQEKLRLQEQQERQKMSERQEAEAKRLAAMEEALNIARETAKDANSRHRRRHIGNSPEKDEEAKPTESAQERRLDPPSTQQLRETGDTLGDDRVVPEKPNQFEETISQKDIREIDPKPTAPQSVPSSPIKIVKTEEVLQQQRLPTSQNWVPVVEMISPDGFTTRGLGGGHPTVLLQPTLPQDQFNSPYCFVASDGNYTPLSVPYNNPAQIPLPFLPLTQNNLQQYALVIPPVQEGIRLLTPSKLRVRRREVGTQTSAGRRRGASGWDGLGSGTSQASKNSRSSLSERPQWGVNRPGAKYVKQSDKDLSIKQRGHRNLRRRTVAPPAIQLSGNYSNPRNRWWSTVQLSDEALSKTYLISSNLVSSDSSSSAGGMTKARIEDTSKEAEDECDAGDEQDDNDDSLPNSNHEENSTLPGELLNRLSALKIVLLTMRYIALEQP